MQRIVVIGSGGSGKSTLAPQVGAILGLPIIHLDRLFWHPGWVETPREEWAKIIEAQIAQPRWVMDGNYGGTMEMRLAACDTVIFLFLSRWICLRRAIYRSWRYRNSTRADMTEGCREKLDFTFLKWIWTYPEVKAPRILEMLERLKPAKTVIVLRSPDEVEAFLAQLKTVDARPLST